MFLVLSLQSLKMKLAKLMNVLFSRRLVPFYASQPLYVLLKFFSSLLYEMEYVVNLCNFDYWLRYVSFEYLWTRWFWGSCLFNFLYLCSSTEVDICFFPLSNYLPCKTSPEFSVLFSPHPLLGSTGTAQEKSLSETRTNQEK